MPHIDQTDKYTFRVLWSDEDSEFVGLCAEFPSLSWLAASRAAALTGVVKVARQAVAGMVTDGEELPAQNRPPRRASRSPSTWRPRAGKA